MTQDFWIVDAFASRAFTGNPAAVCLLDKFPSDEQMQRMALQAFLPETAFVVKRAPRDYDLRWFTPETEVNLCGHATLATTHVLQQSGQIQIGDSVTYHTQSGDLNSRVLDTTIELDFPALPGVAATPHAALKALGVDIVACEKNRDNYLVEVKDYKTLLACAPAFKKLAKVDAQGVIVTTATGMPAGFDFASRYFAPQVGIDEDLATGSAHCFLGPYWAKKLKKTSFHAYQASKGKGVLDVTVKGDRVLLAGKAITTLKGDSSVKPKPAKPAHEVQEMLSKIRGTLCT